MELYHKIQSVFMRDDRGVFQLGEWSRPELGYLAGAEWEWTEKVDGTNIRIGLNESMEYQVGGRTDRAHIPVKLLDSIEALGLREKLPAAFNSPVTLYGEGYGAKIQKGGGNYRQDNGFVLFDVKVGDWWLLRDDVEGVAATLGIDVVPLVGRGSLFDAIGRVIPGLKSQWGDFTAEGLVCRPVVPLFNRKGERIIVKVKTVDFDKLQRAGVDVSAWLNVPELVTA